MAHKYSEGKDYKVVAFLQSMFFMEESERVMRKIISAGEKNNVKFVFFSTFTELNNNDTFDRGASGVFNLVNVEKYDAVVIMSESFKNSEYLNTLVERCNKVNVPVVSVVKHLDNCINFVYDYGDTFGRIVEHLIEVHGYKSFAFMAGIKDNIFSEQRYEAFRNVLNRHNIVFDEANLYYGDFWEAPTLIAMKKLLEKGIENLDAIVCANDSMAITVINQLKKNGYRVPEDIAVTGFDGIELGDYCIPVLTTSAYNVDEFITYLISFIKCDFKDVSTVQSITIYNTIKIGQSCGCAIHDNKDASNELMHLKSETEELILYQIKASQRMAALNDAKSFDEFMELIGHHIYETKYKDFYICCNERMTNLYLDEERRHGKERSSNISLYHFSDDIHKTGTTFRSARIASNQLLTDDFEELLENNSFVLVLPMHVRGISMGYFVMTYQYDVFDILKITGFVTNMRYILEIKAEQQKAIKIYLHDSLTGLYNRNGFYEKIDDILDAPEDTRLSIISLDIDGLKKINDTFGHSEGDKAIIALGRIIRDASEGELAARIGGDEFLIAIRSEDSEDKAKQIVSAIEKMIHEYNETHEEKFVLNASIGMFTAETGRHSLDYFIKKADELMYEMKAGHYKSAGIVK